VRRFFTAFTVAAVLGAALGAPVLVSIHRKRMKQAHDGWEPRQVLALTRPVAAASRLSVDDVVGRHAPEQFVTGDQVEAHEIDAVVGRQVREPLFAGQTLSWTMFADRDPAGAIAACAAAIRSDVDAAGEREAGVAWEQLVKDRTRREAVIANFPPRAAPPPGDVAVVMTSRELAEGALLAADDLQVQTLPRALFTDSYVLASELPRLIGAKLQMPLEEDEPLRWQMLDHPDAPESRVGCWQHLESTRKEARARNAAHLADEHFRFRAPPEESQ
jgi:Flp pilus assembly protein CpaB